MVEWWNRFSISIPNATENKGVFGLNEQEQFNMDVRRIQIAELLQYGVDADFIIQLASIEPDALTDFVNGIRKLRGDIKE